MSDNLKKYSFNDLISQGKLRIPKIQRDYAQGRQDQKVNNIRKEFVHSLLLVVKGKRPATELDFVYGSNQRNAFEPLDGQQRLTTLFLLHWMMGIELNVSGDKKHSIFTYETRNTSDEFCDELVQHNAKQFVDEALKNKEINKDIKEEKNKKLDKPSYLIKGRDWFKWEWKYDPTILSMLVMIDAIYEEMGTDWDMDMSVCQKNLDHITFNLLNLGEFGLSNELFIKMNARGKQLSDFDKLKSTLEEELQIQQRETSERGVPLATEKDEEQWRTLMDGAWIDFFWHKYARTKIIDTETIPAEDRKKDRLNAAKLSELQFKKLLLRLIALQLFENNNTSEKLSESAYNIEEARIDDLLVAYTDSLTDLRSDDSHSIVPSSLPTINFKRLIEDVNLLIYKDEKGIYWDISSLLPQISHIDNNEKSILDSFLDMKVPNDVELVFYSMLLFLRAFPEDSNGYGKFELFFNYQEHSIWLKNLEDWVRSLRNILLNDNNNQRIDKILFSKEATQSLKQMADDFVLFVRNRSLDVKSDKTVVKLFFASSDKNYQRLDNQSMAEERLKAKLIIGNSEWENLFDRAEQHPYLWGQIRCLLNWSNNQLRLYEDYSNRLLQLLDFICNYDNARLYYTAMLVFAPDCWTEGNRLFQYNKSRDNSFKRYLREHTKEGQAYGTNIKAMIDLWRRSYSDMPVKEFLNAVIVSKDNDSEAWIQCVVKRPNIIDEAWNKRIFISNGHPILAQRLTRDSHCFDPILLYFQILCKDNNIDNSKYKFYDSKGDYEHAFELQKKGRKYHIEWAGTEGLYSLKEDEEFEKTLSPFEVITYMENIISQKEEELSMNFDDY